MGVVPLVDENVFRILRVAQVLRGFLRLNGRSKRILISTNRSPELLNDPFAFDITQLALKASNLRNATIAAVLQAEVNRSICEETFYPARNK